MVSAERPTQPIEHTTPWPKFVNLWHRLVSLLHPDEFQRAIQSLDDPHSASILLHVDDREDPIEITGLHRISLQEIHQVASTDTFSVDIVDASNSSVATFDFPASIDE